MTDSEQKPQGAAKVSRNAPPDSVSTGEGFSLVTTGGEIFPDGRIIELLYDKAANRLLLLLIDEKIQKIEPSITIGNRTFVPPELSPSFLTGLTFPSRSEAYGSPKQLFESIHNLFRNQGVPEDATLAATYFIFSSWFLETLPAAPGLTVVGPRPEALHLLQLISCMALHSIRSHENAGADRWFDLRCVTIESLLHYCHRDHESRLYVGKISSTAELILKGRGQSDPLEPKIIGRVLRSLGFSPRRGSQGFSIELSDKARLRVHRLAREHQVAASQKGLFRCKYCAEFVSEDSGPNRPESSSDPGTSE